MKFLFLPFLFPFLLALQLLDWLFIAVPEARRRLAERGERRRLRAQALTEAHRLEASPLTEQERRTFASVLAKVKEGERSEVLGHRIKRARVARGMVLGWVQLERFLMKTANYENEYQKGYQVVVVAHGWLDTRGKRRVHLHGWAEAGVREHLRYDSGLLNNYTGAPGDSLLVVYDEGSSRHVVFANRAPRRPAGPAHVHG